MTNSCRVLSGVVMALVMIGVPVAPLLCDLVCPMASAAVATGNEPSFDDAAAHDSPPCHDSSAAEGPAAVVPSGRPAATAGLDASQSHRCDHPGVIAPRPAQSLRAPVPSLVAWGTARRVSPFLVSHALLAAPAAAGASPPPSGGVYSPVLRI